MSRRLEDLISRLEEIGPEASALGEARLEGLVHLLERADDLYSDFHWGRVAEQVEVAGAPRVVDGTVLVALGPLYEISYLAQKGKEPLTIYEHAFQAPLPILAAKAEDGSLVVVGGGYEVTARGIVG